MAKTKIKAKDIAPKGKEELNMDLKEIRGKLLGLRMRRGETRNKNVKEVRELKKNAARILTLLNKNS
ncbi:50S ribosomal protein L29 [Candidatus Giovannonibacteria bacterium RIFCSPHIGHO2_02_43_13]|uniref:Large ribosomal subunit protein uL29 n=1 Tax=Candidatus Giovannonibacteria bacterium RIFCSPHIGHO2_02_43_13 TaxID=1798330 RepID=A0A1F5WUT4_9BACT|nr:MAG: 50S ribosomal protein L29P [Parcubacteria group bacterium GW2011_GWA2_44_13]OGF71783.1 MAG: 50S ribosomal protein L29 [Candidatus Giovannonibacteria bacterium RIFCSPHIGHO2_12_FULL_44_42]OGF79384.1 MAG: 50S ribosomal protein L29 [Candidatus Giovannonibacteria bacterium RIFCSPHIGHO2_02_43_13]OGF89915.1 MAG: 50S ribosomal protein L29 [Candidatus Giovannonibacteria bacterium RIFCSPLOWO2_02_FULL_43_54]OGF97351.1 MAG: 50S ribosomal protein L29 [Candidatus Giovannonibacteria bacterium RIFCSPLO